MQAPADRPRLAPIILLASAAALGARLAPAQAPVTFNRDVRPLLSRCFNCHGRDEQHRKAHLRLDRPDGPDGAYRERDGRPAIAPGSLEDSAIWYRLTTEDPRDAMPPPTSHQEPLTEEERAVVARWIEQGAEYEEHWAFVAPSLPELPAVGDEAWCRQPIDRFVLHRLEAEGLRPQPEADRRALIRRVTFDLTGLPPAREEIRAFLGDRAPGAYERLVRRLLERPQYGEHMARYWLDLVRFADTNGVHHDHYREMSLFRDWVIRSFNDNRPFDEFVTDQIAGDLRPEPTDDQLIASGFNRLHMIIDVGTALPEESLVRNVVDRVTAVGTAFLGLTVGCAVCHDHKYDPISQREFYQLFAFFNNLDAEPETGRRDTLDFERGLQEPYVAFPTDEQTAAVGELDEKIAAASARLEELKATQAELAAAKGEGEVTTEVAPEVAAEGGDAAREKELDAARETAEKELAELRAARKQIVLAIPAAMVMKERPDVRPAHVLIRGDYASPGELVERDTPAFLPPSGSTGDIKTRMDLARWLVSPEHPLTARVTVNRLWQQFFGVGIVKTSEDFGTRGEWPSHPELLDWLAVAFVESGWDVKRLVQQIVLSATYRQSSVAPPEAFATDPENRLLARGSRFRMDAEMIRDQILATSGLLVPTMYGKSVKPPQPPGIWKAVSLPSSFPRTYVPDTGDKIHRRSVYTFWKRGMPPPQMTILDAPTRESCTARRERTNTALQALLLLNERQYLEAARHLARCALQSEARSPSARLDLIYETITSRLPDAAERQTLLRALRDLEWTYAADPLLCDELGGGEELRDGASPVELAAWTMVASAIYNLDITKTRG